jgi:hypothetical protein
MNAVPMGKKARALLLIDSKLTDEYNSGKDAALQKGEMTRDTARC